jgi:hypothetical protein
MDKSGEHISGKPQGSTRRRSMLSTDALEIKRLADKLDPETPAKTHTSPCNSSDA